MIKSVPDAHCPVLCLPGVSCLAHDKRLIGKSYISAASNLTLMRSHSKKSRFMSCLGGQQSWLLII